jgi:iron uptake system component EfeO
MRPPNRSLRGPKLAASLVALSLLAGSCAASEETLEHEAVTQMHASVSEDLASLVAATKKLQSVSPTPAGRGWDPTLDAAAIADMKAAWIEARVAYEHVEGALAPLFPDLDRSLDARYDDFLEGGVADEDAFDDRGVTGLHAAERIIFSDVTPASVVALEKTLAGYRPARFPSTEAEAREMKDVLLAKIVSDAEELQADWQPARIDLAGAYTGLVDLMSEQREKVNKAGNQEEESRYSQRTLADVRANLAGTRKAYEAFRPWLRKGRDGVDGEAIDRRILAGFDALGRVYDSVEGDAFPPPPPTWSAEAPSEEDLETPFGKLYTAVDRAVDPSREGSIVSSMDQAGRALGLSK